MFNMEIFLVLGMAFAISYIFYSVISRYYLKKELQEAKTKIEEYEHIDFGYAEAGMDFLDRIIEDKYTFHLYTTILPIYLDQKIPEKKMVSELKEKIYVSVVGGLTLETKKSLLNTFTEKGIEIYINERIMIHVNKTDFRSAGKYTEAFKDLKGDGISTLIS